MESSVVVVEDDPDILELLLDVLAAEGIPSISFSAPDTLAIEQKCPNPTLFLIDMMLPRMSGVDLARHLRQAFPRTPMIAMSASLLMLEAASASGEFQGMLAKPFNLSELTDVVIREAGLAPPAVA